MSRRPRGKRRPETRARQSGPASAKADSASNPQSAIQHPQSESRLWLWALLVLALLMGCVEIEDPDIFWHIRTGQLIVERGEVPRTDWFTYTNADSPWIDLHWSFQIVAAWLWSWGGTAALVLAKSALLAATLAVAMLARQPDYPWRNTVACWLPALLVFWNRNQVRPETVSYFLLAATLAIVFHARNRPRWLWLLPVIQVLWINVQGLFILGLVVWGCFLADVAVAELVRVLAGTRRATFHHAAQAASPSPPRRAELIRWSVVSGLMLLAALANPYGLDGALFPFTLLRRISGEQHAFYSQFAGEFLGPGELVPKFGLVPFLLNLGMLMQLVVLFLGLISFARLAARGRFSVYRGLVFAAFAYLAWQATRNGPLFALVGSVVTQANFSDCYSLAHRGPGRYGRAGSLALAAGMALLLAAVPTNVLSPLRISPNVRWYPGHGYLPTVRMFGLKEMDGVFPHAAVRFLGQEGMPQNCFAGDEGLAAVYTFHNGPRRLVFADGRLEVIRRETLRRWLEIESRLTARDANIIAELTEGLAPGGDGRPETPALLLATSRLCERDAQGNQPLLDGLLGDDRFRLVYVDPIATVFLTSERAERLQLPEEPLEEYLRSFAQPLGSPYFEPPAASRRDSASRGGSASRVVDPGAGKSRFTPLPSRLVQKVPLPLWNSRSTRLSLSFSASE